MIIINVCLEVLQDYFIYVELKNKNHPVGISKNVGNFYLFCDSQSVEGCFHTTKILRKFTKNFILYANPLTATRKFACSNAKITLLQKDSSCRKKSLLEATG